MALSMARTCPIRSWVSAARHDAQVAPSARVCTWKGGVVEAVAPKTGSGFNNPPVTDYKSALDAKLINRRSEAVSSLVA